MHGRRTITGAAIGLTGVGLLAAGCGSSNDDKGSTSSKPGPSSSAGALTVPVSVVRQQGSVGVLAVLKVHGKPYIFKVDTGATNTQVDTRVAKQMGLRAEGKPSKVTTLGCTAPTQGVRISDWSLAGRPLPSMKITSTKQQGGGQKSSTGIPFAGLLGGDVLSQFKRMTLNFAGGKLVLGGAAPTGGKAFGARVAHGKDGAVLVIADAKIGSHPTGYVIDTGAGTTTIDKQLATKFGLHPAGKSVTKSAVACSATTTPVKIATWSIGGVQLPPAIAAASPSDITKRLKGKVAGLLGANVMAAFGSVTIDFDAGKVVLGPKAGG